MNKKVAIGSIALTVNESMAQFFHHQNSFGCALLSLLLYLQYITNGFFFFIYKFEAFISFLLPRQLNQFTVFPFIVLSQQIDFYVHKHIFIAAMGRMQAQTF